MSKKDRKTKIEHTLKEARKIEADCYEASDAWIRLCRELESMVDAEARPPRFNGLLRAIWVAATNEQS